MKRLSSIAEWRAFAQRVRDEGGRVGLVPTMGALHEGHLSLVERARANGDVVILTSFVNPRQFSDQADLAKYPRSPESDAELARVAGVSALVSPAVAEMWPDFPAPTHTTISVARLGDVLEGVGRPGHFDGVASVVAKLFAITGPCRAYFGEKDFQQVVVVRQMVRDLAFDVEVVACPTRRDETGLALSSRNVRLSGAGRERATALSRSLRAAREASGPASARRAAMAAVLAEAGVDVAYAEVVDETTLEPLADTRRGRGRAVVAGVVDSVRLIDNAEIDLNEPGG